MKEPIKELVADRPCPVCKKDDSVRKDFDFPETMFVCESCGSEFNIENEILHNAREILLGEINVHNEHDLAFICELYGLTDTAEAIQRMYEEAGWECTDIDTLQFMKVIEEDRIYQFTEERLVDPLTDTKEMVTMTIDLDEYDWWQKVEACKAFGYTAEQVDQWMDHGEEWELIAECIFEMEQTP